MARPVAKVRTRTSAISLERRASRAALPALSSGFTLIELLVVFAIAGLMLAITPFAYSKLRDTMDYRSTLRHMASEMRQSRQQALASGQTTRFVVDLDQRRFGRLMPLAHRVPDSLKIRVVVGESEMAQRQAAIAFLPDGGASGGSVELVRPSGEGSRLRVDWLTGQVTQEALLP